MHSPITERQQEILKAIVTEHVKSAQPVGSKEIATTYKFDVSPATLRSEMNALERAGLVEQPHTSAGRVPTDAGYRLYVKGMLGGGTSILQRQQDIARRRLMRMRRHYEALARETAELLAEMTNQAAFADTGDHTERAGFSNMISLPELRNEDIAKAVADVFDHPDRVITTVKQAPTNEIASITVEGSPVTVYIGEQTGLGRVPLSVLATKVELDDERSGHLVLLGPSRMHYSKNVAMLAYMSRLLTRYLKSNRKYLAMVAILLPSALIIQQIPQ